MLRETSAFGVRKTIAERRKLRQEFTEVNTGSWQGYRENGDDKVVR